ncbi:DUF2627 domain-containing protein [Bacillus carboniphilus]|uniref:DUF2627 domain-containing protein n=1 Tax=Bacillus carboniphilus TaxID=86663 RepID=A0ABN0WU79_9BACI
MDRIIALIIMLIPGILAGVGIKWMRDTVFTILHDPIPFLWLQFLLGLALTVGGIAFIAGFIFRRDRKNQRVQKRFR